jgi:hypothetical protein
MDDPSIEANVIRRAGTDSQSRDFCVDGDAPGPDPRFGLAA